MKRGGYEDREKRKRKRESREEEGRDAKPRGVEGEATMRNVRERSKRIMGRGPIGD